MRWAVAVPLLLISRTALAQQPIPCRPTSIGFACPGDLICDTKLLQCVTERVQAQEPVPCQLVGNAFLCPGDLVCNAKQLCVEYPHHPHAEAMRNAGTAMTLVGSIALVIAINLLVGANDCLTPDDTCKHGLELLAGGVALLGAGIPLWAIGQHWLNRYPLRAELFLTPANGGAMAGVRLIDF